jgi:uncharacterized protein (TIGR03067 family)
VQPILFLLALLIMPSLLDDKPDDEVQKDLKALQGTWKTVAMEAGGKPLPKDQLIDFTIVVAADGKSTGRMPQGPFQFTMTVNPKKTPKQLENLHESGEQKGKKQYGVYKLEGDKFTVCVTARGAAESTRPKDFNTKDTTNVVFVFERVKDGK